MSTIIVRPTAVLTKDGDLEFSTDTGGTWNTATDAQIAGAVNDSLDTTGVRNIGATSRWATLSLGVPTIASDEIVARVGGLLRWTSPVAGKTLAAMPYALSDGAPGYTAGLTTIVQAAKVTAEPSYVSAAWTLAQAAALGLSVYLDGDATPANRPCIWELGATLYTLKLATAVPTATTMTSSTTPVVPVAVTATIDAWQAATFDWQGLRKITAEVRVESGGSGAGTGTLITSGTVDVMFTATGSKTVNITLPSTVANGTYNLYARATRHRENEASVAADQVGVWSTAATLTMSTTPPTTPTVSLAADDVNDKVTATITPISSAGYSLPVVSLQRSVDGGLTWVDVRNCTNITAVFGTPIALVDYEAPRGITTYYRARVQAYVSAVLNASNWSAQLPASLLNDTWNLKIPQASALNVIGATVIGNPSDTMTSDQGIFRALDRKFPVVVFGTLGGWDGDLTVRVGSQAEWLALKALLEAQLVLYLESPFGWAKYIAVKPDPSRSMMGSATIPRAEVKFQYVETSAPIGVAPVVPLTITVTIDCGSASTVTFADSIDGGTASTTVWAGFVDGGSV